VSAPGTAVLRPLCYESRHSGFTGLEVLRLWTPVTIGLEEGYMIPVVCLIPLPIFSGSSRRSGTIPCTASFRTLQGSHISECCPSRSPELIPTTTPKKCHPKGAMCGSKCPSPSHHSRKCCAAPGVMSPTSRCRAVNLPHTSFFCARIDTHPIGSFRIYAPRSITIKHRPH
jgi:hypothetical protein